MKRNTETLRHGNLRHYSIEAARERGFEVAEGTRLVPKDGACDAPLVIPPESADAVTKALFWVAELPDVVRIIFLDKILRRTQAETAKRLGLSKGRLSQILAKLGETRPEVYRVVTGKPWTGVARREAAADAPAVIQLELDL